MSNMGILTSPQRYPYSTGHVVKKSISNRIVTQEL